MNTKKTVILSAALLGVILFAMPALSTVVEHMTIERLTETATLVVLGDVSGVEARWNQAGTKIYTHTTVTPIEILKGNRGIASVPIKQIGGSVGATHAELPGSPVFTTGERVLLFLEARRDGDGYMVIGLFQGKYKVVEELSDGEQILERDIPDREISIVDPSGKPTTEKHTLSEVRALVKGGSR